MKKLCFIILLAVFTFSANAQEKYQTSLLGSISVVTKEGKSQGEVYLDLKEDSSLGLSLNKKEIAEFVDFLKSANNKFKEWDKVAKENAVQELRKEYKKASFSGYFKYAKWKFGTATLSAKYTISKGKASGYIYIPSFESSSNQFIKSKPHLFYITDELIKEMKNYLSDEAINTFVKSKTSADDLFEND
jgi:hypothetical protein